MDAGTSSWASGHRCGRRDIAVGVVDSWCGQVRPPAHPTSSWSVRGRRDVDRAVGTSTGPSGRRQGRRDVDRAVGTSSELDNLSWRASWMVGKRPR